MDTDLNLYFYIERLSKDSSCIAAVLDGHDFAGGLKSYQKKFSGSPMWIVSNSTATLFQGRIAMEHQQGRGYTLRLIDGNLPSIPCLLTSDPNVTRVYRGPVSITAHNTSETLDTIIGNGIPLRGEGWLGIVQLSNEGTVMDVYSNTSVPIRGKIMAYCPWWSSTIGEEEGQFTITTNSDINGDSEMIVGQAPA